MPLKQTFEPMLVYDAVRSLPGGHDNGTDPLLLPRTKAAFIRNGTVRGNFARPRGAYRIMSLDYSQTGPTTQPGVEQGFFQCAAYYKPDVGNESLMLAASGRLFQFVISGQTATVFERTIAGDPNSSTAPQNWMWQSEQFLVWNDGILNPVFFDGSSSRRSNGAATAISTVNGTPIVPAIGSTVNVTLNAIYSGPYNVIVSVNYGNASYLYSLLSNPAGVQVTITNVSDSAGASRAAGTKLIFQPNLVGFVSPNAPQTVNNSNSTAVLPVNTMLNPPHSGDAFGDTIMVYTSVTGAFSNVLRPWQVISINGNNMSVRPSFGGVTFPIQVGFHQDLPVTNTENSNPSSVYTVSQAFTAPPIGSTVNVFFNEAFTSLIGQYLTIQNDNATQYQITAISPISSSATVVLKNLNDTNANGANTIPNGTPVTTVNELPAGRMGAYWLGRNWMALTDGRKFIASDLVGGSSGTTAYAKRDAPLRVLENTLLAGGGYFIVPSAAGDIRAFLPTALLDASLGQGPLSVLTPTTVFSCLAPVDRSTWQNVTNPLLPPSVISNGGQGQASSVVENSDFFYRATDGIRSQILARRDFATWGNVPISFEVSPTINQDNPSLLPFASAAVFNNRLLMTTNPVQSGFGVYHPKLVAINFDPLSNLQGKAPAAYDGIWDGLNVLQLVGGKFGNVDRLFAFCVSQDQSKIELWEIMPSEGPLALTMDNGNTPIQWEVSSGSLNFFEDDPRRREDLCLKDGEIRVDGLTSDTLFEVFYKPDQYVSWVPWHHWIEPFIGAADTGFRPSLGFGEPNPKLADTQNDRPLREAVTFQVRLRITGHCRILWQRFQANTVASPPFAPSKPPPQ